MHAENKKLNNFAKYITVIWFSVIPFIEGVRLKHHKCNGDFFQTFLGIKIVFHVMDSIIPLSLLMRGTG